MKIYYGRLCHRHQYGNRLGRRASREALKGTQYINIDSEVEGTVTLGAAGGIKTDLNLPLTFLPLTKKQLVFSLHIAGLLGGHSGLDINKGRANATVLIARALENIPFRMIKFSGGTADNAIPRTAEMLFALSPNHVEVLKTRMASFEQDIRKQYPSESHLSINLAPVETRSDQAASEVDSAKVVKLIMSIPQGVHEWSKEFVGLPETSNNIGIVKTENQTVNITTFQRSFNSEKLEEIARTIEASGTNAGAASIRRSTFPAWPPTTSSDLYKKSLVVYESLFKTPLKTEVVHAGLECGYIARKYPAMEIISIGPTLENVHSPRERLYVPSLERVARFLKELMRSS